MNSAEGESRPSSGTVPQEDPTQIRHDALLEQEEDSAVMEDYDLLTEEELKLKTEDPSAVKKTWRPI